VRAAGFDYLTLGLSELPMSFQRPSFDAET
jgi:hypothetical protein